ncbi:MAG: hypothetical protein Q8R37_05295 [Nanoarchaeota archaeon]|nr:hypothetical protein [Nanoarchaeota archaeon]
MKRMVKKWFTRVGCGVNLVLQVVKPIVADIDNNGAMETVTLVHDTIAADRTYMYAVETTREDNSYGTGKKVTTKQKWSQRVDGGAIYFPATLANIEFKGDVL